MKFDFFLFSFAWWLCNRYLKFVLLPTQVFTSMPKLYMEIVDLEYSLIMYSNLMIINWSFKHLDNCGWYFDYSKNKTSQTKQGFHEQIELGFFQHVVLEEKHGEKQKKPPLNKNLNLDNATIAFETRENKCKVVDLEGENVTKLNIVIEEAYDYMSTHHKKP